MATEYEFGPRWMKQKEAARYCGYSVSQFKKLASQYQLPKHGPSHNHYDRLELDRWMRDSVCFIEEEFPSEKRYTGTYSKVYDAILGLLGPYSKECPINLPKTDEQAELQHQLAEVKEKRKKEAIVKI